MGFLRGFSIVMGANGLQFFLSFFNNKLLSEVLSVEDYGKYFLVVRLAFLVRLVTGEWLRLTNINLVGESRNNTPALGTNTLAYVILISLILSGIYFIHPGVVQGISHILPLGFIWAGIVVGMVLLLRDSFQSILLASDQVFRYGVTFVLWGGSILAFNLLFLIILKYDVIAVVVSLVIATCLAAVWSVGADFFTNGIAMRPSGRLFAKSFRMGIRAGAAITGTFLMMNVVVFLIERFSAQNMLGALVLGIFGQCFRIMELLQRISNITGNFLMTDVARNSDRAGYQTTAAVCRNLFAASIVLAGVTAVFGKYILLVIASERFLSAYGPLLVMLPGIVFINAGAMINSLYWGRGYPLKSILPPYIAAGGSGLLGMFLIPRFGAAGATLTFTIISGIWLVYLVVIFRRDSGIPLRQILVPTMADMNYLAVRLRSKAAGIRNRRSRVDKM